MAALWRFWQSDGHLSEGRTLAEAALTMSGAEPTTTARAWATGSAGSIAYWQADVVAARRWYEEQLALAKALDDETIVADAMFNLAHIMFVENADAEPKLAWADEVRQRYRDLGDERAVARIAWSEGTIAMQDGRAEEAIRIFESLLPIFDSLGDLQYHAMATASIGWAAFSLGDIPTAMRCAVRSLVETNALHDVATTTISLHVGVLMASVLGKVEDGARLSGAFDGLCERYGVRPPAALALFIGRLDPFGRIREALTPESYASLYESGRRLTIDEAVALVVAMAEDAPPG